ncbi:uncharacterized protein G2W53_022320 [Senna tora]|uniref:Uncharacterized protein n=1 Tax=Senna tora TaxID=362788 RepID=A0A834TNG6_9FABA|nr:uncharacterized protein G2W53_022320 [Senna tora]
MGALAPNVAPWRPKSQLRLRVGHHGAHKL